MVKYGISSKKLERELVKANANGEDLILTYELTSEASKDDLLFGFKQLPKVFDPSLVEARLNEELETYMGQACKVRVTKIYQKSEE